MSTNPKPVSQTHIARYCKVRLGIVAEPYMSAFALACRALEVDGFPCPPGTQPKKWAYQHAAHIIAVAQTAEKKPSKASGRQAKPSKPKPMKAAKWTAARSIKQAAPLMRSGVDVRSADFLQTYEWRVLRMQALKLHGPRCQCCGATPATGAVMNVDHIKPRRIFPELALTLDNLQILCGECNHGKSNWDMTDWRGGMDDGELEPEQREHLASI